MQAAISGPAVRPARRRAVREQPVPAPARWTTISRPEHRLSDKPTADDAAMLGRVIHSHSIRAPARDIPIAGVSRDFVVSLAPLLNAVPQIPIHAFAAMAAFVLGIVQFVSPKGTLPHRTVGWIWVGLMATAAVRSCLI